LAFLAETEADDHPAVAEVLGQIGGRLVDGVKDRQWPFHFLAVRSTQLNAFALPGGFIFVTRPLLEFCHWDRDELAFVLGHEMGHVLHRHAIDRVMASSLLSTAVGRLLPARGLLRLPLGSAITTLLQQSYSRDQELEADRTGVQLARVAGYDAAAASRLLARLQANIGTVVGWDAYFLSHPPADVRIEAITRLLRSRPSPDQ
jgi:predicted Zn-dependent protease